jgi:hypothetical protein
MFLSIWELRENRLREGRTFVTGVSENTFTRTAYRLIAWHFESKARVG